MLRKSLHWVRWLWVDSRQISVRNVVITSHLFLVRKSAQPARIRSWPSNAEYGRMQKRKGQIMIEKCKKQPLKSACWIYLVLTLVPGVFLPNNTGYLTESFVRYLLPGAIACWIAVKAFGAQRSSLGVKGFWKSLLYSSPIAVLCIINLVTAKHGEIAFHQVVLAFCTALGEELMARLCCSGGLHLVLLVRISWAATRSCSLQ